MTFLYIQCIKYVTNGSLVTFILRSDGLMLPALLMEVDMQTTYNLSRGATVSHNYSGQQHPQHQDGKCLVSREITTPAQTWLYANKVHFIHVKSFIFISH
uniref:Uncharacterized protein n=1 Tax=Glossina palpalis gambiensis TaxID=67801 RepID=A0A1B0AXA7_9MUSC